MKIKERDTQTVFVVDDDPVVLKVIVEHLHPLNFEVIPVRGGEALLKLLPKRIPDLILLDIMMPPGIDGFALCRKLKECEKWKDLPVIFLTALVDPVDKVKGFELGAVDYITKPVDGAELCSRVTTHLALSKAKEELEVRNQELTKHREHLLELVWERTEELEEHRKKLEVIVEERTAELTKAVQAAEVSSHAKSIFISSISHEIRTPLNSILGFSQILKSLETDPKKKHFIKNIESGGKNLLNILNSLIDFSGIEAGKMELKYGPTSLYHLCNEIMDIYSQRASEKRLELTLELEERASMSLELDKVRLRQVLCNLIDNAIKFTKNGSVTLAVTVSARDAQGQVDVDFRVEDSGIGIAPDYLETIFNCFEKVADESDVLFDGVGIGLSLIQRLVEMMGGKISVTSEQGKGSCFSVRLTGVKQGMGKLKVPHKGKASKHEVDFVPAVIVIATDKEQQRQSLNLLLAEWEFTPVYVKDGKKAISEVIKHLPDLLILDMKGAQVGDFTVPGILQQDSELKDIPIIALLSEDADEEQLQLSTLCSVVLKEPIERTNLLYALMKILRVIPENLHEF